MHADWSFKEFGGDALYACLLIDAFVQSGLNRVREGNFAQVPPDLGNPQLFCAMIDAMKSLRILTPRAHGWVLNPEWNTQEACEVAHHLRQWLKLPRLLAPLTTRTADCLQKSWAAVSAGDANAPILADAVITLAPVRSGERWLDIGAGSGAVGLGLSQSGAEVVLSDRPEIAQSWDGQSLPANVEIQASDVLVDELKGQFDGVLLCRFIEICSPTQALMLFRKIRRILAKGGRLCLAGYFSPDCPLFPLFGVQVVLDTKTGRTYTHQELVHLAQQAGYDSVNAHVNRVGGYDIVIIPTAG